MAFLFATFSLHGQNVDGVNTCTPYSMFGLGELSDATHATSKAMGGIGVGIRDNRFINIMNPASLTARDTLSFMFDVGLAQKNIVSKNTTTKSAYNTGTIQSIIFSTPLYHKSALAFGIVPFSDMGYDVENYENDSEILAKYGDVQYNQYGSGSLYQGFIAGAFDWGKYLSFGAQAGVYFGSLDRHSDITFNTKESMNSTTSYWTYEPYGYSLKLGVQYSRLMGEKQDAMLTVGATWRLSSKMRGDDESYFISATHLGDLDTAYYHKERLVVDVPFELGLGVSYRKFDKWMAGLDVKYSKWSGNSSLSTKGLDVSLQNATSVRAGFEFVPNRYDIRYYFKRITYRCGVYYDRSYLKMNGQSIDSKGVTLGFSFPVNRLYNAFNLAVDFGQRGTTGKGLVKENYVNFTLNISLHDLWFIKQLYQ